MNILANNKYQVNRHRRSLLLPMSVVYLFCLFVVLFIFGFTPTNDGMGYLEYARNCLAEGAPYPTVSSYQHDPFIWNIGIINLIELSLWLTETIWPVLVLLCVMKACTAFFMSKIAECLLGYKVAVVALLLFILYPNNFGQSTMLSSEIPSTCLATIAVWLAVSRKCLRYFFLSGFLLGLANWFRPTAIIFIASIVVFFLFTLRRKSFLSIVSLLSGFIIFITIVGGSCYFRTGHFVYQARSYWFSMVDECYDGAAVSPHWNQPLWPKGYPRYVENHDELDCFELESIWKDRSLNWLKDHKIEYLKKIPGRIYYMYQSDYDNMSVFVPDKSNSENSNITIPFRHLLIEVHSLSAVQWLSLVSWIFYIILLGLMVVGTFRQIKQKHYWQLLVPLFIVFGGTLALVFVMHGETRFKDPLMPFVFILASSVAIPKVQDKNNRKGISE